MISTILFYGIGIAAGYFVYRYIYKSMTEEKCATCPQKDGCMKKEKFK